MHSMACFVFDRMTVTDEPVYMHTWDLLQKYMNVAVHFLVVIVTHNYKQGDGVKFYSINVTYVGKIWMKQ
jgi:hypothetical protein